MRYAPSPRDSLYAAGWRFKSVRGLHNYFGPEYSPYLPIVTDFRLMLPPQSPSPHRSLNMDTSTIWLKKPKLRVITFSNTA